MPHVYAGTRGRSVLSASLDGVKAGIKELSRLSAKHPDDLIDAWTLLQQETTLENSRDWKTGDKDPKITTTGAGSDDDDEDDDGSSDWKTGTNPMITTSGAGGDGNEPNYESSADGKEGIPTPTIPTSGAGGDGDDLTIIAPLRRTCHPS